MKRIEQHVILGFNNGMYGVVRTYPIQIPKYLCFQLSTILCSDQKFSDIFYLSIIFLCQENPTWICEN